MGVWIGTVEGMTTMVAIDKDFVPRNKGTQVSNQERSCRRSRVKISDSKWQAMWLSL